MDALKKEIRRILRGHFTYENDGALIVATQNPLKIRSDGMFFGIDGIRVLGMGVRSRTYQVRGEAQETQDICVRNMLLRGQQIILQSSPNTLAILHFPITANPSVLTLDDDGDQYRFRVYTARSPLARRYAAKIFEKWEYDTADCLSGAEPAASPKREGAHDTGKKRKTGGKNSRASSKRGGAHLAKKSGGRSNNE